MSRISYSLKPPSERPSVRYKMACKYVEYELCVYGCILLIGKES